MNDFKIRNLITLKGGHKRRLKVKIKADKIKSKFAMSQENKDSTRDSIGETT